MCMRGYSEKGMPLPFFYAIGSSMLSVGGQIGPTPNAADQRRQQVSDAKSNVTSGNAINYMIPRDTKRGH